MVGKKIILVLVKFGEWLVLSDEIMAISFGPEIKGTIKLCLVASCSHTLELYVWVCVRMQVRIRDCLHLRLVHSNLSHQPARYNNTRNKEIRLIYNLHV